MPTPSPMIAPAAVISEGVRTTSTIPVPAAAISPARATSGLRPTRSASQPDGSVTTNSTRPITVDMLPTNRCASDSPIWTTSIR